MAEHPVPERLVSVVIADLVSRIAEMGVDRPEGADEALAILRALPEIDPETELEISWYSEAGPPAGVDLTLNARHLCLTVDDYEGSQEIYRCDAGFFPDLEHSDLDAWITHFRCLNAPEITISAWVPKLEPETPASEPLTKEIKLADKRTDRFYSCVTLELREDDSLRMLVYDTGAASEECFGGDFDRWVDVGADAKDALLLALIEEKFSGDIDAMTHFREFCESKGVPHKYDIY